MSKELAAHNMKAAEKNESNAALNYFGEMAQKYADSLNFDIEVGVDRLLLGKLDGAKESFQHALNLSKRNPLALLGLGECLLKEIALLEATRVFSFALQSYPDELKFYEKTAQALLSYWLLISRGKAASGDLTKEINLEGLLKTLVFQEQYVEKPFQFLEVLATFYTKDEAILPVAAEELKGFLQNQYEKNQINKNFVLVLIYLRDSIADTINDAEISRLHKQYFHKFSFEDIKLPYNFLFNSHPFRRNKQDLQEIAISLNSDKRAALKLELYHLLFLAWLNEGWLDPVKQQDVFLDLLNTQLNSQAGLKGCNQAAARSLLLRYLSCQSWNENEQLPSILSALAAPVTYQELLFDTCKTRLNIANTRSQINPAKPLTQSKPYQAWNALNHLAKTKIPSGLRRSPKLKVAICVSGQLRGFQQAFLTWKKTLLVDVDYDIFVHTWQRIGRSEPNPYRAYKTFEGDRFLEAYKNSFNLISYDDIKALYPSLFSYISGSQNITKEELSNIYETDYVVIEDETEERFQNYSNSSKMHYKIYACHQYALSQNKKYDLYVRIRPDKPISLIAFNWQDLYRRCRSESLIFIDGPGISTLFGHPAMGDQLAVGDATTMSVYANTWNYSPAAASHNLLNWSRKLGGHASLATTCWTHGIRAEKFPVRWSDLLDSEPLPIEMVLEKIKRDAAGRMNELDRQFINALEADIAAQS